MQKYETWGEKKVGHKIIKDAIKNVKIGINRLDHSSAKLETIFFFACAIAFI